MKTLRLAGLLLLLCPLMTPLIRAEQKKADKTACDCAKDKDGKVCGKDKDCCCTGDKATCDSKS